MEAELTALDTSGVEAEWLRDLLMDLPVVEKLVPAILMKCDNQDSYCQGKEFKGQHAIHKAYKKEIQICQTFKRLRSDSIGLYPVG